MNPSYLKLGKEELKRREEKLFNKLQNCDICAWKCGVNRFEEEGKCNSGIKLKINAAFPHFGEERCLVGRNGSGTIFLSNCNLSCIYCQNWEISQKGIGNERSEEQIAEMMIGLQKTGCHNINWVSPTHFVPQLVKSLRIASEKGLNIPIVYNTGGYDELETLKLLEGIVDIYMPDMKYGSNENALNYSKVPNYWDVNREAVKEMHRQVGDLKINEEGIAERGLLIRHLVLPNNISESEKVLKFIAEEISKESYVNIMDQYYPSNKAYQHEELNRRISKQEYNTVIETAKELGLHRGFS